MQTRKRNASRALLISPEREILLMKITEPSTGWTGWITPGGGLEPGEHEEAGLLRELSEELGLHAPAVGPKVWRRTHVVLWESQPIEQSEVFFLVPIARFDPGNGASLDELEKRAFREFR